MSGPDVHPLRGILVDAVDGRYPPVDGDVELHSADEHGTEAIVEFTGHAVVLSEVCSLDELLRLGADGYGGATHPDVQRAVAGPTGHIGCFDLVLVTRGRGGVVREGFSRRDDLADHPRVARALEHRRHCEVLASAHGVSVVGRGLVDRREVSVELFTDAPRGRGTGRELIEAGVDLVPADEIVFAQVSTGNVASLRAFLNCGFRPICGEILVHRDGRTLR